MRERHLEPEPSSERSTQDVAWRASVQRLAARVQHELNNPLAALLAEAQLLGMDATLAEEHRVAVDRIVELTRRIVATVRELESLGDEGTPRGEDVM